MIWKLNATTFILFTVTAAVSLFARSEKNILSLSYIPFYISKIRKMLISSHIEYIYYLAL